MDCVNSMVDVYLDSEILGFTDALLLPISSTFTRHSRILMILRKKVVCVWTNKDTNLTCKDFADNFEWRL